MENNFVILTIVIVILFWIYKRLTSSDDTLEAQEIAHEKPLPIVGNILPLILQKESGSHFFERLYKKFSNER